VLKRDYEGQICSIARTLEVVGDRWTLLVIRDVVLGNHRFDQLLTNLGIASNVLTDRLSRLVDEGILERVRYRERPERFAYHLTDKGRELGVALIALMQWGDRHLSDEPPRIACRRSDRTPITVRLVGSDDSPVRSGDVELVPGPGLPADLHQEPTRSSL
jgi:DNA-binding HxlR family transcriptional regulator